MADSPQLMNEQGSRTETGEIKDQAQTTGQGTEQNTNTTQTEQKTETKPESTETKVEAKDEAKPGAPEAYTAFTVPEGITLAGDQLTKATELFKASGLSQEAAQSMVDFHVAQMQAAADAPMKAYNDMRNGWKTESESDPDIGPMDGVKAKAIKENIGRALDSLGDSKLKEDFQHGMNLTGIGDNKAFIKVLNKLASAVIEPRGVKPGGVAPVAAPDAKPKSIANAMYPNLS